jgi:chondroitin 4-sulfotransferase 11
MPSVKENIATLLWNHKVVLAKCHLWNPIMNIYASIRPWEEWHENIRIDSCKAIYFPIPKVACSSLKSVCSEILVLEKEKSRQDENVHYIQFSSVSKKDFYGPYRHYFKFGFVRNPWDRIISLYQNKMIEAADEQRMQFRRKFLASLKKHQKFWMGMSFEAFVEAIAQIPDLEAHDHFRSQYIFLTDSKGRLIVDYVGRFETLNEGFSRICDRLGITGLSLPQLMKSNRAHYSKYYTPKTRDMVAERYSIDIEMFKYDF